MKSFILCIAPFILCIRHVLAGHTYSKLVDITGPAFYDEFSFYNGADPTHGRVFASLFHCLLACSDQSCLLSTYIDQQVAQQYNLTYATDDAFILRADYSTYLEPSDPGRRSFRIVSNRQLTTSVVMYVGRVPRYTLHSNISPASIYITFQKDAGEPLDHALICFMFDKPHLEHGQPSGL